MSAYDESSFGEAVESPANLIKVGFIVGPTGSGKTAIAIEVAERLGAEIVNADSRQLYRGMDIGTAKPSAEERRRVPHHLIDVRGPDEPLDVAEFVALARRAIFEISSRRRPVLIVGGSGFYLRALRGGIFSGPPASPEIRSELEEVARQRGIPFLHDELAKIDPPSASRIQRNDLYRIIRAFEVHRITGIAISVHQQRHRFSAREFDSLTIAIEVPRERLYAAINDRFDAMIAAGFTVEVRRLLEAGYNPNQTPLSTIGYREVAAFIAGEMTLEAAVELAKRKTRQFAKRQLTWFRHQPEVTWVDADHGAEQALNRFTEFFSDRKAL
ncbi:MAG TPA: tRNA (adenosine(37)-N6)-dimethylallyltransferase MiaA [Candidatus Binataceae bacterium]|nr:tRNA (adenosine(37)-N6)-dimethylallyltransferase MiaA [Candidatus Binataceae bacterium]